MLSYKIQKFQATNFRNLFPDIIEFGPKINCILGENGNGKTNILEAIYVLANRKSFRKNTSFPQYLGIDGEKPEIILSSVFEAAGEASLSYSAKIEEKKSQFFLEGKIAKKRPAIKLVFINPFDSYGFHNIPASRRTWFDHHISLLDSSYKKTLNKYGTALRSRNVLLSKKPPHFKEQIKAYDRELAKCSVFLTEKRLNFISEIGPYCESIFRNIFAKEHKLDIELSSKVAGLYEDEIYLMLQSNLEKDMARCVTSYGVHKDDYVLLFDGLNSFDYCSLGQQKMSYLSLLFAYIELFRYKFRAYPIVLIDDVSGELDKFRWKKLVEFLEQSEFQVLITTANEKFKEELEQIQNAKKIYVESGRIS